MSRAELLITSQHTANIMRCRLRLPKMPLLFMELFVLRKLTEKGFVINI